MCRRIWLLRWMVNLFIGLCIRKKIARCIARIRMLIMRFHSLLSFSIYSHLFLSAPCNTPTCTTKAARLSENQQCIYFNRTKQEASSHCWSWSWSWFGRLVHSSRFYFICPFVDAIYNYSYSLVHSLYDVGNLYSRNKWKTIYTSSIGIARNPRMDGTVHMRTAYTNAHWQCTSSHKAINTHMWHAMRMLQPTLSLESLAACRNSKRTYSAQILNM